MDPLLQLLPPWVRSHLAVMAQRTLANRAAMCWCRDLDLDRGVARATNLCHRCGRIVWIVDIHRFKMIPCHCPVPIPNEFFFCQLCSNVVLDRNGRQPEYSLLAVKRAVHMLLCHRVRE